MPAEDRTLAAAGFILIYATVIGFTDNYVRVIAAEAGLWQFHATRSLLALMLVALLAIPLSLRLRPVNVRAVLARSTIHGLAMLIYFGSLAFLPVAQVAAGLFTAPIFVLLISHFAFGQGIGPVRILAVAVGFLGVILVLGPTAMQGASVAALLPILAGAMYALGNIATRRWCGEESAETLLAGFFAALGLLGLIGLGVLALVPVAVPDGADGFIQRLRIIELGLGQSAVRVDMAAQAGRGRRQEEIMAVAQKRIIMQRADAVRFIATIGCKLARQRIGACRNGRRRRFFGREQQAHALQGKANAQLSARP
jgi:drug/metabolite transporter (DMT)-like permease